MSSEHTTALLEHGRSERNVTEYQSQFQVARAGGKRGHTSSAGFNNARERKIKDSEGEREKGERGTD